MSRNLSADKPSLVQIIPVNEERLPIIAELAGAIWRKCYPDIISSEQIEYMLGRMYALHTMRDELQSQGIRYDLLLVNGEPVGFASYGPVVAERPSRVARTTERTVPVFKLHKLYLLPTLHGKGLGSRLLKHVEGEVRAAGAHRLILSVNKGNAKAIVAYQRNGFIIAECVITDIGGGFVMDDYLMAKELAG